MPWLWLLHKELCVSLSALALLLGGAQVKVKQPPDEGCGRRRDLGGDSTALGFDLVIINYLISFNYTIILGANSANIKCISAKVQILFNEAGASRA